MLTSPSSPAAMPFDPVAVCALRMERQCLLSPADEDTYLALYRDLQPGQNVYWNGFGQPPTLSFRAAFDDLAFNRERQARRDLIKGRFVGGTLGWIVPEDLELFMALYRKPLVKSTAIQQHILELIEREGPLTIQQIKAATGLLVKEITPALHRLQEAFLLYEDQYDGGWDRGWYRFGEMFPEAKPDRFSRSEALEILLQRFAYRQVVFDAAMVRSFYKLPIREIQAAIASLEARQVLIPCAQGYLLAADAARIPAFLTAHPEGAGTGVYALHRNDFLYKSREHQLKAAFEPLYISLPYDHEPLQYLLIDGEFHGAVVGHFRNGPYDLNDVVCDLPDAKQHRDAILEAVRAVNFGRGPARFMGQSL